MFQEFFHKLRTPQDSLVRKIGFATSSQLMNSFPSSSTSDESSSLKFRPATERDTCRYEGVVLPPGTEERGAEMCQHGLRCLPGSAGTPHKDTMASPRVSVERG